MKWSKLVANLVGNATSAIVDLPPEAVYADAGGFAVERRQLLEALAVMRRLGLAPVALPGADVRLLAAAVRLPPLFARPILRRVVAAGRGGKDPSLRIHARSGSGPSEVGWLNGAVARAAETFGGDARVNRRLAALAEEVLADPVRRAWFEGRPDRLAAAVLEREGDAYGATVNLASRATSIAYPGTVVVSPELRAALADCDDFAFRNMRPRFLKHIGRVTLSVLRRAEEPPVTIRESIDELRPLVRRLGC